MKDADGERAEAVARLEEATGPDGAPALAHAQAAHNEPETAGKRGLIGRFTDRVARARRRFGWLDHGFRAAGRYEEVNAGRLAAAITYFAFFAVFPLLLLGFSILGFVLADDAILTVKIQEFLDHNLPGLPVDSIANSRSTAGILGLIGLFYAGLGWVDAMRSSIRTLWGRNQQPGNYLIRKISDAGVLIGLGAILLVSIGLSVLVSAGAQWVLRVTGMAANGFGETTLKVLAFIVGLAINVIAFVAFLVLLPRLRMSFSRVIAPAFLGALGLELLKTVGRLYVERTQSNPAYKVVGGTIGLLVFLYLYDQLLLFCAALTATAEKGEVTDRPSRSERRAAKR